MLLTKSKSFSFRVSYSPNITQIKLFFKFNKFGFRFLFQTGLPPCESRDVSKKKLKSQAKTIYLSYKFHAAVCKVYCFKDENFMKIFQGNINYDIIFFTC